MMMFPPKNLEPDNVSLYKQSPEPQLEIPASAENRKPTDVKFLTGLKVTLLVLLPFVIYTLCYSNVNNYDSCGNICGKKNAKYDQWYCTGKDYTDKKFLEFTAVPVSWQEILLTPRQCVSQCSKDYQEIEGVCLNVATIGATEAFGDAQYFLELENFLQSVAWKITIACFFSLGVSLTILYLFRVSAAKMVWSILIGGLIFLGLLVIILWEKKTAVSLSLIVIMVILIVLMARFRKEIFLVIALFQEAMKVTVAIPRLLLIPVLAFFAELLLEILFLSALFYMLTAGTLTEIAPGIFGYQLNFVMKFTIYFSISMLIWISQFLVGIQYMVIAGTVSKWYFAKDKNNLNGSILTSASIAFKFHLGSVAFGSLIVTLIAIIRSVLSIFLKNRILKTCFNSILSIIEDFLNYLSKNAYIMTAMHGKPFFQSGKRAARILLQNISNTFVLNFIGSFIICMTHVAVAILSVLLTSLLLVGENSKYELVAYVIVIFVSIVVTATCFSIFQILVATIYLCYCEDRIMNDGVVRPYAMSRDLMEFMENSKKVVVYVNEYTEL